MGPGFRQDDAEESKAFLMARLDGLLRCASQLTRKEACPVLCVIARECEASVRCGFSAQALTPLEYWIARSRRRQGFAAALQWRRAEALATKAASRA